MESAQVFMLKIIEFTFFHFKRQFDIFSDLIDPKRYLINKQAHSFIISD